MSEMQWRQIIDTTSEHGYVGYIDEARANAWFARAEYLTSVDAWNAAKVPGGDGTHDGPLKIQLIHDAWEAYSYGMLSCDVSPWADPIYRGVIAEAYGSQRLGPLGGFRGISGILDRHWLNLGWNRLAYAGSDDHTGHSTFASRWVERYRLDLRNPTLGTTDETWVIAQVLLTQGAEVSTFALNGPSNVRGDDDWFPTDGQFCGTPVWGPTCYAWRHIPTVGGGEVTILPTMTDGGSYSQIQTLARAAVARGARRVVDDAARNAFLVNAATAVTFNLPGADELAEAASRQGIDLHHFNGNGPRPPQIDAAFPAIYTVAALAAGAATAAGQAWLGAIIGAVVASVDLFTNIIGSSGLVITDQFGQLEPAFVTWRISGKPGADIPANRPRQVVPDAPALPDGYTPAPAPMIFFIPALLPLPPVSSDGTLQILPAIDLTPVPEGDGPGVAHPTPGMTTGEKIGAAVAVVGVLGTIGSIAGGLFDRKRKR